MSKPYDEFFIKPDPNFLVCDSCNAKITKKQNGRDIALTELYWMNWGIVDKACYDWQFRSIIETGSGHRLRLLKVFKAGQDISEVRRHATLTMNIACPKCKTISVIDTVIDHESQLPQIYICKSCGFMIEKPFGD